MTRGEFRQCPCCGTRIQRGKLMCIGHWKMVPKDLQRAVNKTWREYRRSDYGHAAIMAIRVYQKAVDDAIAAVMGKIQGKEAA